MAKTPAANDEPPGVSETPAAWLNDAEHAETIAALAEYRRTGVSYSVEESVAELRRLVAERRARRA